MEQQKPELPLSSTLLVGFDFSLGKDYDTVIVGHRTITGRTDIINAFQGEDARAIYDLLVTKQNK